MRISPSIPALISACLSVTAVPAMAAPSLDAAKADMGGSMSFTDADLDGDGEVEAVAVAQGEACEADTGCPVFVIDRGPDGAWQPATIAYGDDIEVRELSEDRAVAVVDGVIWAWNGNAPYPYHSLLERQDTPGRAATPRDAEIVNSQSSLILEPVSAEDLYVFTADLLPLTDGDERVIEIRQAISPQVTPYMIVGSDGEMIIEGSGMDIPRIFFRPDGRGVTVIDVTPEGYIPYILETEEDV